MNHKILRIDNIPKELYNLGERKYYKKNDIIIKSGDIIENVYILVKGSVILVTDTIGGVPIYSYLCIPPYIFGEMNTISKEEMVPTVKCVDNVEVIKISKNDFLKLVDSDKEISNCIQKIFFYKMEKANIQTIEYATLSPQERIKKILLEFVENFGKQVDGKIKINYKISYQFISNFTTVNKVTTYRVFEKLYENNILEFFEGYYYVKNLDLLKEYSESTKIK